MGADEYIGGSKADGGYDAFVYDIPSSACEADKRHSSDSSWTGSTSRVGERCCYHRSTVIEALCNTIILTVVVSYYKH